MAFKEKRLPKFCDEKECMANTWFEKQEQRKITYSMSGNKARLILCWMAKAIPWE